MNEVSAMPAKRADLDKSVFGFWVYLMTDCVLFASLFAVYAVLHNSTAGGPGSRQLFDLPYAFIETVILLTSSFVCGLAMITLRRQAKLATVGWIGLVCLLGAVFLAMEINEFHHLISEGNGWQRSGFLSAYFVLVATHGLHIAIGLLWGIILMVQTSLNGLTAGAIKRLTLFGVFWHFLDLIWVFIFSIVYLLGVIR